MSDDNFDLFSGPTEAEKKAAETAKQASATKKKPALKSVVVLDVAPEDSETDMKVVEEKVRAIATEGLEWKASKLVDVAYGIKKLQISMHVVDDIVSVDDIVEKIEQLEGLVQSVEITAFNKLN